MLIDLQLTYFIFKTNQVNNHIQQIIIINKMGNQCTNKKFRSKSFYNDTEPEDAEIYNKANLPLLQFQICISNIILKNAPANTKLRINLSIDKILDKNLQLLDYKQSLKWKVQQKKEFQINQYQLRKKFIVISVITQENMNIGFLSLNLYLISIGPYHQDFPINFSNKSLGRISLDIRISQIVDIYIKPYATNINLLKNHPGQAFHYSLKTITLDYQEVQSEDSYSSQIKFNKRIQQISEKQEREKNVNISKFKNKKQHTEIRQHKIKWTEEQASEYEYQLPYLKSKLLVSQIRDQFFQFLLWKTNQKNSQNSQQQEIDLEYAECYISFNKFFMKQPKIIQKEGIQYEVRDVEIFQKIWNQGKLYGSLDIKCNVVIQRFLTQMIICVRTQRGIHTKNQISDHFLENPEGECQEIIQLNTHKLHIQNSVKQLTNFKNQIRKNEYRILTMKRNIYEGITNLLKILQSTPTAIYIYNSKDDLIKGQFTILDIGFRLYTYLSQQQTSISQLCWKVLTAIMNRNQLVLAQIGFTQQEKKKMQSSDGKKIFRQKIEICIKYQTFLYNTLKIVLHCLNKKALLQNEKSFTQLFCAYSFFRIPQFRKKLLHILPKSSDPDIKEWKALQINMIELAENSKSGHHINLLFDWQQNFYKPLHSEQKYQQNYLELQQILQLNDWKQKISKRGVTFFSFLSYCISYIETINISDNISWQYIDGYKQLISVFLCQMKIRPILKYPDSLKQTSIRLLSNQNLLNIFMHILFKKTNLMESMMTIKTIELINQYFQYFSQHKKRIPTNFDYKFFFNVIKQILSVEHSFTISKCIWLIYNNYNLFASHFRRDISLFLMGKVFFKLFLNWAVNIRNVFFHLLLYRIYFQSNILHKQNEQVSRLKSEYENNDVIQRRYKNLMIILENAKKAKIQQTKKKFKIANFQKEYYKKMRKKIQEKRKNYNFRNRYFTNEIMTPYFSKQTTDSIKQNQFEGYYTQILKGVDPQRHKSSFINIQLNKSISDNSEINRFERKASKGQEKFASDKKQRKYSNNVMMTIIEVKQFDKNKIKKVYTNPIDFQIPEIIESDLLQYLQNSLEQFKVVENVFNQNYLKSKNCNDVPKINIQYPFDEADISPDDIDQW